jgi:hypothetical protein
MDPEVSIPAVQLHFDILNLEYDAVAEQADATDDANDAADADADADHHGDATDDEAKQTNQTALVQRKGMKTISARDGIRNAVKKVIDTIAEEAAMCGPGGCGGPGPGPGPAPGPVFLELFTNKHNQTRKPFKAHHSALSHSTRHALNVPSPAPIAAPMAAPAAPDVMDTFVALEEGPKDCVEVNTWIVDEADRKGIASSGPAPSPMPAAFIDRGSNGQWKARGMGKLMVHEMEAVCKNPSILANALLAADGIKWKHAPAIGNCKVTTEAIERFNLDCAPHVKQIISRFSVAYTRAQVPHAIEQACHLFESKISFSGNRRITKWDRKMCKHATEKLMNEWEGGKNKSPDYDGWCHKICEWKLGKGAPQCRI